MKKKIIPYISFFLILSFVLPFFPCFSLSAFAEDSVSSDDVFIKWEKDNVDAIRNGLAATGTVVNPDFYLVTADTLNPNLWEIIARNYNLDYQVNVGKPLSRQIYDYTVSNNISNSDIYNNCFNSIYNDLNDYKSYFVYSTLHGSDLYDLFLPYANTNGSKITTDLNHFNSLSLPSENSVYFISTPDRSMAYEFTSTQSLNYLNVYEFSFDFFNDNFVYFTNFDDSRSFLSAFDNNHFYYIQPIGGAVPPFGTNSMFKFFFGGSNNVVYQSVSSNLYTYRYNSNQFNFSSVQNLSSFGFLPLVRCGSSTSRPNMFEGGFFLVPGSIENFSFPVFKSYSGYFDFVNGDSFVYEFDPDIDISKYGDELDLTDLYDVISDTVSDAEGNIIDSINGVANNYLKKQVRLLGDIKNALNDSFGNSWLRLIHDQLSEYFPDTIESLGDVVSAISNLSFSGGGGSVDLSSTNTILTDIYNRLGLMLGPYNGDDFSQNTLNHITNELASKMPFCVVTDVVVIAALFSHEPVHPDFQFPVPFQPGETFEIDISFWEYARPFINAFFIILFIIGLIVLTQKIFNSLKG